MNRTKIICTSGPSIDTPEKLEALIKNGMSLLRINCSHGAPADFKKIVTLVRSTEKKLKKNIGILIDLQGPKIRVGVLDEPLWLKPGELWELSSKPKADKVKKIIPVGIKNFSKSVSVDGVIYMDDGLLSMKVEKTLKNSVLVRIIHGGQLHSRKGINIPFYRGTLSAMSTKDKKDLLWGLKNGIDIVALSFVRKADDITRLKALIKQARPKIEPLVIAKIEKPEALDELDAIIQASDGVMVARGDLGIELAPEKVPVVQKLIIERSRFFKKPVIVATQMLDSMRYNPIPTRAEVGDVANSIFSGTDAVLLTGETSTGQYPIETCATLRRIINEVEEHLRQRTFFKSEKHFGVTGHEEVFLFHAMQMAESLHVKAIMMLTKQGRLIKVMSKFHPRQPIYCLAQTEAMARRLNIYWGVRPMQDSPELLKNRIKAGKSVLKKEGVAATGDRLLLIFRDYETKDLNLRVIEI